MKIIRGELTPAALIPPNTRYDATCNCIQVTTDNGSTWQEAVGQDPRHQPAYLRPPVAGSEKQCDAAANMVKWLHDFMDEIIAALAAGAQAIYAANTLITFLERCFPFAAYFIELVFEAAVDLFGRGSTDLAAAFDTTTYDALQCIFFCHADTDGRIDAAALTAVETDIVVQLNTTAAVVVNEILFIQGEVGLSNAGAIGSETGDCTGCDCGWCKFDDLTLDCPSSFNLFRGNCDGGNGVTGIFIDSNSQSDVYAEITLGATFNFTHISMRYSANFGGANGGAVIQGYLAGVQVFSVHTSAAGSHLDFGWDGNEMIDYFNVQCNSGTDSTPSRLEQVEIRGLGTPPSILNDC